MSQLSEDEAHTILAHMGIPMEDWNEDLYDGLQVLTDALLVRAQRERKYKQLWKKYGWKGVLMHLDSKQSRLMRLWWEDDSQQGDDESDLDDAYDLINYATFFLQLAKKGNKHGG